MRICSASEWRNIQNPQNAVSQVHIAYCMQDKNQAKHESAEAEIEAFQRILVSSSMSTTKASTIPSITAAPTQLPTQLATLSKNYSDTYGFKSNSLSYSCSMSSNRNHAPHMVTHIKSRVSTTCC